MTPIDSLLDWDEVKSTQKQHLSRTVAANIETAKAKIISQGGKPSQEACIVDCDASKATSRHIKGYSPCITRSRMNGHWLTYKNRRMRLEEMFRLQGMSPHNFSKVITNNQLGMQIGNAMSVNVIERVIL